MPNAMTFPLLAGLAVLGTAGGVSLGRSAIAEINPAYFSAPQTKFHADLVPHRSPDWAQVQVREYHQAGLVEGLGSGCIGCRDYPVEYIPQPDPGVAGYEDGWAANSGYEPAQAAVFEEQEEPDPRFERVRSYSSYPVTAEEEARASTEPEAEAEADSEPVAL